MSHFPSKILFTPYTADVRYVKKNPSSLCMYIVKTYEDIQVLIMKMFVIYDHRHRLP